MVATGARVKFTYEDYCNAPEDKRYELHDGDLILVPSPGRPHQNTSLELSTEVNLYVRRTGAGFAFAAPFDVVFSDVDVVQPDLIFVSRERESIISHGNIQGAPDLLIEVLSPSTAHRDRTFKRALYAGTASGSSGSWIPMHKPSKSCCSVPTVTMQSLHMAQEKLSLHQHLPPSPSTSTTYSSEPDRC